MQWAVVLVVVLAVAFDVSNGFHDSSNVTAAMVATGAATPGGAVTLSAVFNLLGPVIAGTAVAAGSSRWAPRAPWASSSPRCVRR